jgi:biotin transport system substrate-specific component
MKSMITTSLNREMAVSKQVVASLGVIFFVISTALGAYVRIPVPGSPVPITLQTFFVVLSGAVLGKRLGFAAQCVYIALSGAWVAGPTGGYILGFAPAAYLTGLIAEGGAGRYRTILSFAAGTVLIYLSGVAWLVSLYKFSIQSAFVSGALPFIPGDTAKILIAAVIFSKISRRTNKIFSL